MPRANNRRGESAELAEVRDTPLEQYAGTEVIIDSRSFLVGKLGINHLTAIARIVMNGLAHMNREKREEIQALYRAAQEAEKEKNPEERERLMQEAGLVTGGGTAEIILALLDEDTLTRASGVLLNVSYDWAKEHLDVVSLLEIVLALVENNDVERVTSTFLTLVERLQSLRAVISKKES